MTEIVSAAASKTIVFVPFRSTIGIVAKHLEEQGYTVGVVHGGVCKNDRDNIFQGFQKHKDPQIIVAQPAAMSHGLTLTAASVIIWYAPITSAETYEQANARITRPGQKHSQLIVNIQGSSVERQIYQRLQTKATTQGVLLDMIKKGS